MSDLLIDFLRARLDEDERVALPHCAEGRRRIEGAGRWRCDDTGGAVRELKMNPLDGVYEVVAEADLHMTAEHIARHDPARVLAEVAAKRAILELHEGSHECSVYDHNGEIDNCTWVIDGGCSTVLLLAQPYAGHPHFHPSWQTPDTPV